MLLQLHRDIDSRTRGIAASHADWPCRKGCDACCRRLAELPRLTRPEWDLLEKGLAKLPADVRQEIASRIRQNPGAVCPFLDLDTGSCLVYAYRPVACRTYGFYVERDRGLYCRQIEAQVDAGKMAEVVWGNIAPVEAKLAELGEKISLLEWFPLWDGLQAVPVALPPTDSPECSPRPLPTPSSGSPDPCGAR